MQDIGGMKAFGMKKHEKTQNKTRKRKKEVRPTGLEPAGAGFIGQVDASLLEWIAFEHVAT